jgi:hypothetical protein
MSFRTKLIRQYYNNKKSADELNCLITDCKFLANKPLSTQQEKDLLYSIAGDLEVLKKGFEDSARDLERYFEDY